MYDNFDKLVTKTGNLGMMKDLLSVIVAYLMAFRFRRQANRGNDDKPSCQHCKSQNLKWAATRHEDTKCLDIYNCRACGKISTFPQ